MRIKVESPFLTLRRGQAVLFRTLAGTNSIATVHSIADSGRSVLCYVGVECRGVPDLYLPVALFNQRWWLRDG